MQLDNYGTAIQAFPIHENVFKGIAASKPVFPPALGMRYTVVQSLEDSNSLTFHFRNGTSLTFTVNTGSDYSLLAGVEAVSSSKQILLT